MATGELPAVRALSGATKTRLPSLTGLRFVAALSVFLFHTAALGSPLPPHGPLNPFADPEIAMGYWNVLAMGGYVGVSFFFVLSGFVLVWSSTPGERTSAFLRRRLLKIFPTHLVTAAIALVLFAAATTPVSTWVLNGLLVHPFAVDPTVHDSLNIPSWSLGSELLFYVVVFPLLIGVVRKIADSRLLAWAGVMIAGIVAVAVVNDLFIPTWMPEPASPGPATGNQFWFGYVFPVARMFEFVLGMVIARLVLSGRWPRVPITPAAVLLLATCAVPYLVPGLPYVYQFTALTAVPIALLIGSAAAADRAGRWTLVGTRAVEWLGERSFGFYMAQGIVLFYGRTLVDGQYSTPVAIVVVIGFLAANVLAGWMLYAFVERPIMRRWSRARTPALSLAPA
jgi:peptidoglycan/LPS O-acetylase OafA/YrhL